MEFVHPFNGLIGKLVFPYLEFKDLLSASMVCKVWNEISMDEVLVSIMQYVIITVLMYHNI